MGGCSGRDGRAPVSPYCGRRQLYYLHLRPAEHMGRWRARHWPARRHRLLHFHKSTRHLLPGGGFASLTIYALWPDQSTGASSSFSSKRAGGGTADSVSSATQRLVLSAGYIVRAAWRLARGSLRLHRSDGPAERALIRGT